MDKGFIATTLVAIKTSNGPLRRPLLQKRLHAFLRARQHHVARDAVRGVGVSGLHAAFLVAMC